MVLPLLKEGLSFVELEYSLLKEYSRVLDSFVLVRRRHSPFYRLKPEGSPYTGPYEFFPVLQSQTDYTLEGNPRDLVIAF